MQRIPRWTRFFPAFLFLSGGALLAQTTTRASVDSLGAEANSSSVVASISSNGRYVAFHSFASNLVSGDTNGLPDVFVKDRQTGALTRVSVDSLGVQGDNSSYFPSLSADGRYVAFHSLAGNLVSGDTNGVKDVFLHDRMTGQTTRVSVDSSGAQGNGTSDFAAISGNGNIVAFRSFASNLVAGDTNLDQDVFVHDRVSGVTTRVSVATGGVQGSGASGFGDSIGLSYDGRYVAFLTSSDLVTADTNSVNDIYVHDRVTLQTTRVSVASSGLQANSGSDNPAISGNGQFVSFVSLATNFSPLDTVGDGDVYVHDRLSGATVLASLSSSGAKANLSSLYSRLSYDGRFVSFATNASNLVPLDTNAQRDVFVRDLQAALTERASVDSAGSQGNDISEGPALSSDAQLVAFDSGATNLVPGDTNASYDVFVHDRGPIPIYTTFCLGDGSGTPCPCGNESPVGWQAGCMHSLGNAGKLTATGNANVSTDTFVLVGSNMPNSLALYFQGTMRANGGAGSVLGDGLLCVGGTLIRLGTKTNVGGTSSYPSGLDILISIRGMNTAGVTRTYQCWFRNAANFCTVDTFNLTNGVEVTWGPCTTCP